MAHMSLYLLSGKYDQFCCLFPDKFVMHAQVNFFGVMMYSQLEEATNQVINQLVVVIINAILGIQRMLNQLGWWHTHCLPYS